GAALTAGPPAPPPATPPRAREPPGGRPPPAPRRRGGGRGGGGRGRPPGPAGGGGAPRPPRPGAPAAPPPRPAPGCGGAGGGRRARTRVGKTCYDWDRSAYVPPGWPSGVHPPGSEDFERTAQAWLLDVVPADYRLHGVLRRYPLALAAMAAHHARACVAGAREGYRNARTEVGGALPPPALEALLAAYRAEGRRLVATAPAGGLGARALRGEVFTPQLQDAAQPDGERPAAERPPAQRPAMDRPVAQR